MRYTDTLLCKTLQSAYKYEMTEVQLYMATQSRLIESRTNNLLTVYFNFNLITYRKYKYIIKYFYMRGFLYSATKVIANYYFTGTHGSQII